MSICGVECRSEDRIRSQQFTTHLGPLGPLASEYEYKSFESTGLWRRILQLFKIRLKTMDGITMNGIPVLLDGTSLTECINKIIHEFRPGMSPEVFCKKGSLPVDPACIVSTKTQDFSPIRRTEIGDSSRAIHFNLLACIVWSFFKDHMNICATVTKTVYGSPTDMVRGPAFELCGNLDRLIIPFLILYSSQTLIFHASKSI